MTDEATASDTVEIIPALFGLLTARFEDTASLAARGQARTADHTELAELICSTISEASILARAIEAIARHGIA